jgi:hypothetical protein
LPSRQRRGKIPSIVVLLRSDDDTLQSLVSATVTSKHPDKR